MSEHPNLSSVSSVSVTRLPQVKDRPSVDPSSYEAIDVIKEMVRAADERKAGDITVLDVGDISYLTEYFMVVTGFSITQVRAIARSIQDKLEDVFQRSPNRVEGMNEGGWVLLDYGEAIVHVFLPKEREFYDIEAFWGHAERVDITPFIELGPNLASNRISDGDGDSGS
ncbi:MAG: ribosome silencing factor [Cyanobacteria bacterium P01_F01_bin.150]